MAFRPKAKTAVKPATPELPPMPETPTTKQVEEQPQPTSQPKAEEEIKQVWTINEIPTETQPVIYNQETGETLDILGALARILNTFEELNEEE
jgi:hypothetical protein